MTRDNQLIGSIKVRGMQHRPGQTRPGEFDVRFSYDMNGILEVEVTNLSTNKKLNEVFQQRPGTLTKQQIREAVSRLQPLKIHPRDLLPNRARLERANRLFAELKGPERDHLTALIDQFEGALESQDPAITKQASVILDQFLAHFFKLEGETQPGSPEADEP